ncbi:DNA-3-methyladenine glycosylase 2 family protein [Rathayibacter rathayi]|uniref:AraC family transcriptional regulator n=1 Tax=Rathayibacter rathayi TaxID=33887 RepID=A0ABD6WA24_RATRA|nr:Ada metal-binding domain-containing protein [Rathayibacter rathayi]PPF14839.1 AraC family transcriptional regulator [Rathayibacter rathayi]PPF23637.1 AraC family transcriptional regulator [Rathayibacter rathayi]PPF80666.1 AraC family transcriptional regulator [Rathayibacter rathayi]PPG95676.1 AraC family transcriptional regulator [Rathayibacter rathayi]PPH38056.1 AraC family transcriptional regulator [Rathayibacter rathayi]
MPDSDPLFEERYRAVASRDSRFDGRFLTGVHSTGIYCRPSCPATTPQRANVRFYPTTAAAHEAGLRACKRCLPDAVPGSPEWNLRDDTAARAMRMIGDGVVDREGVEGLAARLGYGARHLGRILREELGAPPLALARAQRAQTARLLLTGTDLPVSDVAFAAGFASIRQFNATLVEVYERTPTALRASTRGVRSGAAVHDGATTLDLRLPVRAPFDAGVLDGLSARALPGLEEASPGGYTRSLLLPGGAALVQLGVDGESVCCRATLVSVADVGPLVARIRRLLDLDADARAVDEALSADPALAASVAARPGIRVSGSVDPTETLVRALIGQRAAGRLVAALGETLPGAVASGSVTRVFPSPAAIAEHAGELLRRSADVLVRACALLADGSLRMDADRDELLGQLLAVPGIGRATAAEVTLRTSGDPDVLLTGDPALRRGAAVLGLPSGQRALAELGRRWAPWRSYAGAHLAAAVTPSVRGR